jgi:hypothetical protein
MGGKINGAIGESIYRSRWWYRRTHNNAAGDFSVATWYYDLLLPIIL